MLAFLGAGYFFFKEKNQLIRADLLDVSIPNIYLASLVQFIGGLFFVLVFYMGGYIILIRFFAHLNLNDLFIIQSIQLCLLVKTFAVITSSLGGALLIIFPFRKTYVRSMSVSN